MRNRGRGLKLEIGLEVIELGVCFRPFSDFRDPAVSGGSRPIANGNLLMHSDEMGLKLAAWATGVVITVATAGCSPSYEIKVLRRDDQTIFQFSDAAFWAGNKARVVSLSIAPISGRSGPVWDLRSNNINGLAMDQIRYGVVPSGMTQTVVPVGLRLGEVYHVDLLTHDGGGSTQFVVIPGSGPAQPVQAVMQ
jgi:hypothetical protein